jgi:hypothetical protein
MPQVILPAIPSPGGRHLRDSALSSASASEADEPIVPPLSLDSVQSIESQLRAEPASSPSAEVLSLIPGLSRPDPVPALDQLLSQTVALFSGSDFRVYHLLTHALFSVIVANAKANPHVAFKALAICVRVMPVSDIEPLTLVMRVLYRMSQNEEFDRLFGECGILKQLMELAFRECPEISTMAAGMLRHIALAAQNREALVEFGAVKALCVALKTDRRRDRFGSEKSLWVYQVIGLFSSLYPAITDFSIVCRHALPMSLLDLTTIYSSDVGIQAVTSKALTLLMAHEECVEVIEDSDLTPFFILMKNEVMKVGVLVSAAIANAMSISPIFTDSVASMPPPLGVYTICEALKTASQTEVQVSLMRSLAKASETKAGIEVIQLYLQFIEPFLWLEIDELENWSPEQLLVANALVVIKNLAIVSPGKAVKCVKGKMDRLMIFMLLEYVVELMKVLMKTEEGREVCREVENVEEIRLFLRMDERPQASAG